MTNYKGINVGDLITTYYDGYWELLEITPRWVTKSDIYYKSTHHKLGLGMETSPSMLFQKRFNSDGSTVVGGEILSCDAIHCDIATKKLQQARCIAYDTLSNLDFLLNMDFNKDKIS